MECIARNRPGEDRTPFCQALVLMGLTEQSDQMWVSEARDMA